MVRLMALIAVAAVGMPVAVRGHAAVDPERLQQALAEAARSERQAREAPGDPEALYRFGEKVEGVLDLLNQEVAAHGPDDVLTRLAVDRLRATGAGVDFSEPEGRYRYDLAAFREYLDRAPGGGRAAAAWFRLIGRGFYRRGGADAAGPSATDVEGLARAVAEEERFLRRYPTDANAEQVRFFLAVDYCRLARAEPTPRRARYRRLGREALELVRARHPGTMEARTAEALLGELSSR